MRSGFEKERESTRRSGDTGARGGEAKEGRDSEMKKKGGGGNKEDGQSAIETRRKGGRRHEREKEPKGPRKTRTTGERAREGTRGGEGGEGESRRKPVSYRQGRNAQREGREGRERERRNGKKINWVPIASVSSTRALQGPGRANRREKAEWELGFCSHRHLRLASGQTRPEREIAENQASTTRGTRTNIQAKHGAKKPG